MAKNNIMNENVNVKVNENKEEKKMTKTEEGFVTKNNETVNNEVTAPMTDAEYLKMLRAEAGQEDVSFDVAEQPEGSFVKDTGLGQHDEFITAIETIVTKRKENPDLDIEAKFSVRTKISLKNKAPIYLYNSYILYEDEEKQDTDVFYADVDPSGHIGRYFTIKKSSLNKKPEEISLMRDCDAHIIKDNQRIWAPLRDEYSKIREILQEAEFEFDNPIRGKLVQMPKRGFETPIYVYEEMPKEDAKPRKVMDAKGIVTEKPPTPFYSASFRAPEEHIIKVEVNGIKVPKEKYECFTTSNDVSRQATIRKLPAVVNYFAQLPERNVK